MKNSFLKKFLILIFSLFVLAFVLLSGSINSIVKNKVIEFSKNSMNFETEIGYISIDFFPPGLTVRRLSVKNDSAEDPLRSFKAKKITVDIDKDSIFTDTIIINHILIDSPEITYDTGELGLTDLGKQTVGTVLDWGMGLFGKSSDKEEKKAKKAASKKSKDNSKPAKKFIITRIDIKGANFVPEGEVLWIKKGEKIAIPDINLTNINENSGENITRHVKSIIKQTVTAELLKVRLQRNK